MKAFYRLIGAVPYEQVNEVLAKIVQDEDIKRNKLRKEALETIENMDVKTDGEKIQKILIELNRDLCTSYEKETLLINFTNQIKP